MNLPHLTPSFPGIGGDIKQRPEDFFVQEIPAYPPSGAGEHVLAEIQKVGLTTFQAVDQIARALNVPSRDIGFAGMKDANAVTRQVFSILGVNEAAVMELKLPGITVLWADRHLNKIRLGHLKANRFAVRVRNVNPTDVVKIQEPLKILQERGMPNYFGPQRFGRRENNQLLGAALVRGDNSAVLRLLLGGPDVRLDNPQQRSAREAFDRGDLDGAMKHWPRQSGMERRVLARFLKTRRPGASIRLVDRRITRLWISALQSEMFNQVVARRIEALGQLMDGDLAVKHENGAVFRVESAAVEQARADRFEISPTGPLIGYRMTPPAGEPLRIEQSVLDEHGLAASDFKVAGRLRVKGARRALRVKPADVEITGGVDEHGNFITVAFTLPAGSFATVLMRELMKTPETAEAAEELPPESEEQED